MMRWVTRCGATTVPSSIHSAGAGSSDARLPTGVAASPIAASVRRTEPERHQPRVVRQVAALAYLVVAASSLSAQSIVGYASRAAAAQRALEQSAARRPDASRANAHSRALSARSHIAGTPAQAITRDYVLDRMREWGLETET